METHTAIVLFALVAAFGLVTVIAVVIAQEAGAAKSTTGQCASTLKNASSSFCHRL